MLSVGKEMTDCQPFFKSAKNVPVATKSTLVK